MARSRSGHDRRHRDIRSLVSGASLPPVHARIGRFVDQVADTADYLRIMRPHDLQGVTIAIVNMPVTPPNSLGYPFWAVNRPQHRITFFRLPIQRGLSTRQAEPEDQESIIETHLYRGFAAYIGCEPWELVERPR